jgi:hypothetical protein
VLLEGGLGIVLAEGPEAGRTNRAGAPELPFGLLDHSQLRLGRGQLPLRFRQPVLSLQLDLRERIADVGRLDFLGKEGCGLGGELSKALLAFGLRQAVASPLLRPAPLFVGLVHIGQSLTPDLRSLFQLILDPAHGGQQLLLLCLVGLLPRLELPGRGGGLAHQLVGGASGLEERRYSEDAGQVIAKLELTHRGLQSPPVGEKGQTGDDLKIAAELLRDQ